MKRFIFIFIFVFASTADSSVIDPDSFASGTNISNAYSGVTLRTAFGSDPDNPSSLGDVFSVADGLATTGSNAFGHSTNSSGWGNGVFEYLLIEFNTPANFVSLDFFANDGSDLNPELLAFDVLGNEITRSSILGPVSGFVTLSVSSSIAGIGSVRAYWDEISRAENGGLDRLVFTVSAPPVIALLFLGLAGIRVVRKYNNI